MCMFRLTPDKHGDFVAPARLASRPSSRSRHSSRRNSHHEAYRLRPVRDDGPPIVPGHGRAIDYAEATPRSLRDHVEVTPRFSTDIALARDYNYVAVAPASIPRQDYTEVAPGPFHTLIRQPEDAQYSIPAPSPPLLIPPPEPHQPVAPPATAISRPDPHVVFVPESQIPPAAPDPPSAVRERYTSSHTRTSAPPSPVHTPRTTRAPPLTLEVPRLGRQSPDAGHERRGHHRTSSHGSRGHSSPRSRSGDRSTVRSGSSRRSDTQTPPTTPRSGTSGSKRSPRLLEEPRHPPLPFRRGEERRGDERRNHERVEVVLEDGTRIRRHYYQ